VRRVKFLQSDMRVISLAGSTTLPSMLFMKASLLCSCTDWREASKQQQVLLDTTAAP